MKNINFGIDLGTTNSGIGKFEHGKVTIFKNPVGFSDTLPSVVSFRKGRLLLGEKALEQLKSNPDNVAATFKRKMGTDQTYYFPDIDEHKTPIELSALILKELLNFVQTEKTKSVVITIPASFDTIQSNATKKAGHLAGIEEVVLLQEPIAACLAYANTQNIELEEEKKWLVYDFGGGTFDVALVNINDKELKIIDHKGNNFLGGYDIDNYIVEKFLCTQLESLMHEQNLWRRMTSGEEQKLNALYVELIYRAEEAKKELSVKEQSFIELEINGDFIEIEITRFDFNNIIEPLFLESFELTNNLLKENNISPNQIDRIVLVGGTTYIPYIREGLKEKFNIPVDASIDPTTAVILGAAYYAGSKMSNLTDDIREDALVQDNTKELKFQVIYEKNSKDDNELLMAFTEQPFEGLYRITREDGGFDTGLVKFETKLKEFVTILPKTTNHFNLKIYDLLQNVVYEQQDITINHGIYNINGQPLPHDICLELDDKDGYTYLERVFKKNDILPLAKTIYKTTSKTILKKSEDKLIINIVEGQAGTLPGSNLSIGYIEINGTDLQQNLLKGMDIELNFKMSESRDLSISIYISSIDLEINEVFNPHKRKIAIDKLLSELSKSLYDVNDELDYADYDEENYTYKAKLVKVRDEINLLQDELKLLNTNDTSEKKFRIDERKRQVLQEFDNLVRYKNVLNEINEYHSQKEAVEFYLEKASPSQKETYKKLIKNEREILESNEKALIRKKSEELQKLSDEIYYNQDETFISYFIYYRSLDLNDYSDKKRARDLIETGNHALAKESYKELKHVVINLYSILIYKTQMPAKKDDDANLGIK